MQDAATSTAEDGSGRVNSVADNLRDWSRLMSQTLQGVDRHSVYHHAFHAYFSDSARFRTFQ